MTNICNLCGAEIPERKQCMDLYNDLAFYTLAHTDTSFIHQHIVDAYGAQHITQATKPVSIATPLIGLYLFTEQGYSGREVQKAHMEMGNKMKELCVSYFPKEKARLNISFALKAKKGTERDEVIKEWAKSVWNLWEKERMNIHIFIHKNYLRKKYEE